MKYRHIFLLALASLLAASCASSKPITEAAKAKYTDPNSKDNSYKLYLGFADKTLPYTQCSRIYLDGNAQIASFDPSSIFTGIFIRASGKEVLIVKPGEHHIYCAWKDKNGDLQKSSRGVDIFCQAGKSYLLYIANLENLNYNGNQAEFAAKSIDSLTSDDSLKADWDKLTKIEKTHWIDLATYSAAQRGMWNARIQNTNQKLKTQWPQNQADNKADEANNLISTATNQAATINVTVQNQSGYKLYDLKAGGINFGSIGVGEKAQKTINRDSSKYATFFSVKIGDKYANIETISQQSYSDDTVVLINNFTQVESTTIENTTMTLSGFIEKATASPASFGLKANLDNQE
jgi:hypothetical protein